MSYPPDPDPRRDDAGWPEPPDREQGRPGDPRYDDRPGYRPARPAGPPPPGPGHPPPPLPPGYGGQRGSAYGQPSGPPAYGQQAGSPYGSGYGQPSGPPAYGQRPGAAGYGEPGVSPYGSYPPPPPGRRTGLVVGVLAGVLALLLLMGGLGWYFAAGSDDTDTATTDPTPTTAEPSPSASPTATGTASPSALPTTGPGFAAFRDPELRAFAARGVRNAARCTAKAPASVGKGLDEAVLCEYTNAFSVLYVRYTSNSERDDYASSAKNGLSGRIAVDKTTTWDADGVMKGNFIAAKDTANGTRFIYWDSFTEPVSGELLSKTTSATEAEQFWKDKL